ncbi:MAG: PKD domain-containing protein [Bacteroidetes bacterium]|nr:PKD domain-containing protein [Bacteroidota bacterium]
MLAERYTNGYTLAESYYMSNPTISWMAVIVGDPKTTIVTEIPDVPRPVANVPSDVCRGGNITLRADSTLPGLLHWFGGDSAMVLAAGVPLDARHPLWISTGATGWVKAEDEGVRYFTFHNENFVGRALLEVAVNVVEAPTVTVTLSADTVYLSDGAEVSFGATSPDAVSWNWDFGDGTTSTEQAPTHRYSRAGTFQVTVTVSNGTCVTVEPLRVVVQQVNDIENTPALANTPWLGVIHPNPVSSTALIPFTLPQSMTVVLRVHDALGRVVATVANGVYGPGAHSLLWWADGLPNGAYLCVLEAGGHRSVQRISVLR